MKKLTIISFLVLPSFVFAQTADVTSSSFVPPPPQGSFQEDFGSQPREQFQQLPQFQQQPFDGQNGLPSFQQTRGEPVPFGVRSNSNSGVSGEGDQATGEDFDGQEKARSSRELARAKQMLRGISSGLSNLKKTVVRLKKKGVAIPAEYEALITELESAESAVKNATEITDEVETALEVIEEKGQELREIGPELGMLEQFPKAVSQAEKQISLIKKQIEKLKKKGIKAGVSNSSIVVEIEGKLSALTTVIAEAKSLVANGDIEEGMDALRENVFEAMEDLRDDLKILENIANLGTITREVTREITRIEKATARLKGKGKDVTVLTSFVSEMKSKLEEVKTLTIAGDQAGVFEVLSSAEQVHNDALIELARLEGKKTDIDKQFESPATSASGGALFGIIFDSVLSIFGLAE